MYKPGLHIISEFDVQEPAILKDIHIVKEYFDSAITINNLSKVGEVYHQFSDGGYTAVICLTESHISIHSWPECNKVTFDVFLSNYMKENDSKAENIHDGLLKLLNASNVNINKIKR